MTTTVYLSDDRVAVESDGMSGIQFAVNGPYQTTDMRTANRPISDISKVAAERLRRLLDTAAEIEEIGHSDLTAIVHAVNVLEGTYER